MQFLQDKYIDVEALGDLARAMFVPRDLVERTGCGTLNVTFDQFINQTDFCNTTIGKLEFGCACCARQTCSLHSCHEVDVVLSHKAGAVHVCAFGTADIL